MANHLADRPRPRPVVNRSCHDTGRERLKPADAPLQVQKAAKRMVQSAQAIEQVFDTRVELAAANLRMQVSFDSASDRFWVATRHRLFYWMAYAHEGLDLLDEEEQNEIELDDKLEKAELARDLDKHLFGIDGLKFLSKPFNQQVALTASRLRFIAGSDKLSDYEERAPRAGPKENSHRVPAAGQGRKKILTEVPAAGQGRKKILTGVPAAGQGRKKILTGVPSAGHP